MATSVTSTHSAIDKHVKLVQVSDNAIIPTSVTDLHPRRFNSRRPRRHPSAIHATPASPTFKFVISNARNDLNEDLDNGAIDTSVTNDAFAILICCAPPRPVITLIILPSVADSHPLKSTCCNLAENGTDDCLANARNATSPSDRPAASIIIKCRHPTANAPIPRSVTSLHPVKRTLERSACVFANETNAISVNR